MQTTPELIRIFMGYDARESIAYHVCSQSIIESSRTPMSITPLKLSHLTSIFDRPREPTQLTDFTYTRFLVPYLCGFEGWALFIDGDMLIREDITNLWQLKNNDAAVMVVQHPEFQQTHSFMHQSMKTFPMFNWSSVMLFNNARCKQLTPEYIKNAAYHDLHQFKWVDEHSALGALPPKWNHLVGYYAPNSEAALVHWTLGGPYFGNSYENSEFAEEWFAMREKALHADRL